MLISFLFVNKIYEVDKEVSVAFEGYDEYGNAIVDIDKEKLFDQLREIKELKDRYEVVEFETMISNLEVEAAPNENLKNDDEIELALLYDEDNSLNMEILFVMK